MLLEGIKYYVVEEGDDVRGIEDTFTWEDGDLDLTSVEGCHAVILDNKEYTSVYTYGGHNFILKCNLKDFRKYFRAFNSSLPADNSN